MATDTGAQNANPENNGSESTDPENTGPEQTLDDTDAGWGEGRDESGHDRWLREQRPPHWE